MKRLGLTTPMVRVILLIVVSVVFTGCAVTSFLSYALWPNYPIFSDGEHVVLSGLKADVEVTRRPDGMWRVKAQGERQGELDGLRVLGYLQARDRMGQLDIFRHLARGEMAALVGDRAFGDKRSLDLDRLNRFLGFRRDSHRLYEAASEAEKAAIDAFVTGINDWISERHLSLEHRLLGVSEVRPWTVDDSMAIYLMVMHSLSSNADREIRRLAIACSAGLEAMERIWPSDIEDSVYALPEENLAGRFAVPPGVVPEMARELPELCGRGGSRSVASAGDVMDDGFLRMSTAFDTMRAGWSASNNWAVSGNHTKSGKPVLSTDPHLPQMNPPMLWGFDFEVPEYRIAGFTLPGLYRVVFGHNGSVAWGATTNHVDRQDLVVHRSRDAIVGETIVGGYEVDGRFEQFDVRTEVFEVRGGDPIEQTVRFTRDGPLLNDLSDDVADILPLVALRVTPPGRGGDLAGAGALTRARTTADFATAIDQLDLGCSSWIAADTAGSIAYRSPCLVPIREGWRGTFPIPGWTSRYTWRGYYPKTALPQSFDPDRGWLATANNLIAPAGRVPTTYNNDVSAPARFERIVERLEDSFGSIDVESSAAIQLDRIDRTWQRIRPDLEQGLCGADAGGPVLREARRSLCAWDGEMSPESVAATVYTLMTNAMLDIAMADELPDGANGEVWKFVSSLSQFEAAAQWLWAQPPDAAVWDDVRTEAVESRREILERALAEGVATATEAYGASVPEWRWGEVRPFVLGHLFAGDGGALGWLMNSQPLSVGGGNETVFKHQFARAHRDGLKVEIGPVIRITIDMNDPWSARFAMAGGQSGWPRSPYYGNLLEDWASGETRRLTPEPSDADVRVRFSAGPR